MKVALTVGSAAGQGAAPIMACENEAEYVHQLNKHLLMGWEAKLSDSGRIYYVNHQTQSSQWVPPRENWQNHEDSGLPYAWENGKDKTKANYYINHANETTQREPPLTNKPEAQKQAEDETPPKPRIVELARHATMGFGFVAGSEKPVVVRFVTDGGPSEGRLMPGDCIITINDEDVEQAPREHVIDLVRSSEKTIKLSVCQPHSSNCGRKSALLTAAKKARLKNNPSRVRFADVIVLNGAPVVSPSNESYIPFMPNVLKVFLENGQTKSFKYDSGTCVQDVIDSLQEKLNLVCIHHFALVLQNMKHPTHSKMTYLQKHQILAQVAARPGAQHLKCLFRLAYVPRDLFDLLKKDPASFEYFYTQCTNDVVEGRYASELKYDLALRLAALHIQQHCLAHNTTKVSLKLIERDTGLDKFLPEHLLESIKTKDLRKMLTHFMKANQNLAPPGQKHPTATQTKMYYMRVLSELRSFGGKCFLVTLEEKKAEVMVLVGPKQGLSLLTDYKSSVLSPLADFEDVESLSVAQCERDTMRTVVVHLKQQRHKKLSLTMAAEDVCDFVALMEGYFRTCVSNTSSLLSDKAHIEAQTPVPPYSGEHTVTQASWSYPQTEGSEESGTRSVDLSAGPPPYHQLKAIAPNQVDENSVEESSESQIKSEDSNTSAVETTEESANEQSADTHSEAEDASEASESEQSEQLEAYRKQLENTADFEEASATDTENNTDLETDSERVQEELVTESDELPSPLYRINGDALVEAESGEETTRLEFLDSTLNSTFSDSMRGEESLVSAVLGVMAHDRSRSIDSNDVTIMSQSTDSDDVTMTQELDVTKEVDGRNKGKEEGRKKLEEVAENEVVMRSPAGNSRRRERPGSFGLHSPDKVPQSAADLRHLTLQYRERHENDVSESSDDVSESTLDHPSYNPKLFCDGGLYLDPDIIDLCLLPPPEAEEEEQEEEEEADPLMDFTHMACPPGFSDANGAAKRGLPLGTDFDLENLSPGDFDPDDLPPEIRERIDDLVANDEELGAQLAAIDALLIEDAGRDENEKESGIDSESDNDEFNEYSATTPTCPDNVIRRKKKKPSPEDIVTRLSKRQSYQHVNFAADDIDAFIASVTVPPPPKEDELSPAPSPPSPPRVSNKPIKRLTPIFDNAEESTFKGELILDDVDVLNPHKVLGRDSWNEFLAQSSPLEDIRIEDDFAHYVLPPPESESNEIDLASIPMVLPPTLSPTDTPTDSPRSVGSAEEPKPVRSSSASSSQNSAKPKPSSIKPILPSTSSMQTSVQQRELSPTKPTQIPPKPKVDPQSKPKLNLNTRNQIKSPSADEATTAKKKHTLKPVVNNDIAAYTDPVVLKAVKSTPDENKSVTKTGAKVINESKTGVLTDKVSSDTNRKPAPISSKPSTSSLVNGDLSRHSVSSLSNPPAVSHARSMSHNDADTPREKRVAPPAPPKRQSSLDTFNQPVSPRMNLPKTSKKERPQSALLSDNRDSKISADAVPQKSAGTLPRGGKRRSAPPPPPRRTSALTTSAEMHELSRSVDNLQVQPPKFSTFGQSQGRSYQRMFGNQSHPQNAQSETSIFNMFNHKSAMTNKNSSQSAATHAKHRQPSPSSREHYRTPSSPKLRHSSGGGDKIRTAGDRLGSLPRRRQSSDSSDSQTGSPRSRAKFVSPTIAAKQNAIASAFNRSVSQDSESSLSSSGGLTNSRGMPVSPGTPTRMPGSPLSPRLYQKPASPLSSPHKPYRPGSPAGTLNKSRSSGSPSASPSRANPPGSPSLGRSNTFTTSSTIPRPYVSPHTSPALHRHSSFSKAADRSAAPFKTFLGDNTADTTVTSALNSLPRSSPRPASPRTPVNESPRSETHPPHNSAYSATPSSPKTTYRSRESPLTSPRLDPTEPTSPRRYFPARKAPARPDITAKHQLLQKTPSLPTFSEPASPTIVNTPPLRRFNSIDTSADFDVNDITYEVLNRTYSGPNTFVQANMDVDSLVQFLNLKIANLPRGSSGNAQEFAATKELLVGVSRTFVGDSKQLVSSATNSHDHVVVRVDASMHTLAAMVQHCVHTMPHTRVARDLGARLTEVARAYKTTVNAAAAAAGKPLSDPAMRLLMKQATSLASILSLLMKTLKALEY